MTENRRTDEIRTNIEIINQKVSAAAERAGRQASDIRIMAVSKTKPVEDIRAAYAAGQRLFGENRIQEAYEKFSLLPEDAELHMIGHLQSNKAATAAKCCACVQSIDKLSTANELNKRALVLGRKIDFLIEINTSGEISKNGYKAFDDLKRDFEQYLELSHINIKGLMTIAPFTENAGEVGKSFKELRSYLTKLNDEYGLNLDVLSMGMSSDFEIAIEEGSTLIRVGTSIFGGRNY